VKRSTLLLFALLLPPMAGCETCLGVEACDAPVVRYEGVVEKSYPGGPAPGVVVDFVRTDGVALDADSARVLTDAQGRFRLEIPASVTGEVVGELVIHSPSAGVPPTREKVQMRAGRSPGDILFLGRWTVPYPHLPYEAGFYYRGSNRPAAGIEVEFRRTGGIPVEPDTFRATTDSWGNVKLRPLTATAGEVTAELVVFPLPPNRPFTITDLRLRTFTTGRTDSLLVRQGIGSLLPYAAVVVWEDGTGPIAGAEVEFRRTSGIPIQPDPYRVTSDAFGTIFLRPNPLVDGEVTGTLTVRPPAPYRPHTIEDFRLSTTEYEGSLLHLGYFGIPRLRERGTNQEAP
jgi:hypothetical protein